MQQHSSSGEKEHKKEKHKHKKEKKEKKDKKEKKEKRDKEEGSEVKSEKVKCNTRQRFQNIELNIDFQFICIPHFLLFPKKGRI